MRQPPTYAGTKGREPCPACNGTGLEPCPVCFGMTVHPCIACNGTRVRPLTTPVAAARRSGRVAGIRRAPRAR